MGYRSPTISSVSFTEFPVSFDRWTVTAQRRYYQQRANHVTYRLVNFIIYLMGFTVEAEHLIKCLQVSRSNEHLILTSIKCQITPKHTMKILYKSKHFPPK